MVVPATPEVSKSFYALVEPVQESFYSRDEAAALREGAQK
jgi:hypothetical protein